MALTATILDYGATGSPTAAMATATVAPADGDLVVLSIWVKEPGTTLVTYVAPSHSITGLSSFTEQLSGDQIRTNAGAYLQQKLYTANQTGSSGSGGAIDYGFTTADLPGSVFWCVVKIGGGNGAKASTVRTGQAGNQTSSLSMAISPALATGEFGLAGVLSGGKVTSADIVVAGAATEVQEWYPAGESYDKANILTTEATASSAGWTSLATSFNLAWWLGVAELAAVQTNSAAPSISHDGTPVTGETLTVTAGTWSGGEGTLSYDYQWILDGVDQSGETGTTYTPASTGSVTVRERATDSIGRQVTATSAAVTVGAAYTPPSFSAAASITDDGTPEIGETLTGNAGTVTGGTAPLVHAYQWLRGGVAIDGATGATLVADTVGSYTYRHTVTDAADSTATSTSTAVDVLEPVPVNVSLPVVTVDGDTLYCSSGDWTSSTTPTYAYQWRRAGADLPGETSATYSRDIGDDEQDMTCAVVATNTRGASSAAVSSAVQFPPMRAKTTCHVAHMAVPIEAVPLAITLRGYPLTGRYDVNARTGHQADFDWYMDSLGWPAYVSGQMSDHAKIGLRNPTTILPVEFEFFVEAIGRGQHFAAWVCGNGWDPSNYPSEIDIIEINVDGNNTAAGLLYSMNSHHPASTSQTFIGNDVISQADRIGKWHKIRCEFIGSDMVWKLDGSEIRRETNVLASWTNDSLDMSLIFSWEISGNWPGDCLTEQPCGRIADPTVSTPWPCGVHLRNIKVADTLLDLSGDDGKVITTAQWQAYVAAQNTWGNPSSTVFTERWCTTFPFGYTVPDGAWSLGNERLYSNNSTTSGCNDTWQGTGGSALPVREALLVDGWDDPSVLRVHRVAASDPPSVPWQTCTTAPAISGTAQAGQTLTLSDGVWSGPRPRRLRYQWLRDGARIPYATGSSYVCTDGDIGAVISGSVLATDTWPSGAIASAPATSAVTSRPAPDPVADWANATTWRHPAGAASSWTFIGHSAGDGLLVIISGRKSSTASTTPTVSWDGVAITGVMKDGGAANDTWVWMGYLADPGAGDGSLAVSTPIDNYDLVVVAVNVAHATGLVGTDGSSAVHDTSGNSILSSVTVSGATGLVVHAAAIAYGTDDVTWSEGTERLTARSDQNDSTATSVTLGIADRSIASATGDIQSTATFGPADDSRVGLAVALSKDGAVTPVEPPPEVGSSYSAALPAATGTTTTVTAANAVAAINGASPGDRIVIQDGAIGGDQTITAGGVQVTAENVAGVTWTGRVAITASDVYWHGQKHIGKMIKSTGDRVRIYACHILNTDEPGSLEKAAIGIFDGADSQVGYCTLEGFRQVGIKVKPGLGARRPVIFNNWLKNNVGTVGTNGHEGIQCGVGSNDTAIYLGAIVYGNLLDGVAIEEEAISNKSSGNTYILNRIINGAGRATFFQRHGEDCTWKRNRCDGGRGFAGTDNHNRWVGNHAGDSTDGFRFLCSENNTLTPTNGGYPQLENAELDSNVGPVKLGWNYGGGASPMAAINTTIRNHTGTVTQLNATGTSIISSSSYPDLGPPSAVTSADVGHLAAV